jgi:Glycosyl transferase family 2
MGTFGVGDWMTKDLAAGEAAHICLGVCTFQRPAMLRQCLDSLVRLEVAAPLQLTIIVVDNEPSPASRDLVESVAAGLSGEAAGLIYVHEPSRGISHARNAAIEAALTRDADWIGFVDDDQYTAPDWLTGLYGVAIATGRDIVKSHVSFVPADAPLPPPPQPRTSHGKSEFDPKVITTNGVMFRAGLSRDPAKGGAGLRFDTRYALTSGEDSHFFRRAMLAGYRAVKAADVTLIELVPPSKNTLSAQLARAFAQSCSAVYQDRDIDGFWPALRAKSVKAAGLAIRSAVLLPSFPLVYLVSRRQGQRQLFAALGGFAKVAGIVCGLTGMARPEPYRLIHGH